MKTFTSIFCLATIMALFNIYTLRAQTVIEKSDTIRADETWSADTVKVTGNITLMDDVTLTIEPGTYIKFMGYYYMNIMGTILANGAKNDTIVFSIADTTDFHDLGITDGSWHGMIFNNYAGIGADGGMNDNDSSILNVCKIEYVKNISFSDFVSGAVEIGQFSRLVISNCVIQHNYTFWRGGGLLLYQDADIQVINNLIRYNRAEQWGGGIFINNSQPTIKGNTITQNRTLSEDPSFGKGGGIGVIGMNPIIRDNIITHNSAIYGSGICLLNSFGLIHGNTITYNSGYDILPDVRSIGGAIFMEETSSPLIRNNLISNNHSTEAGGIYATNSQPDIINNLIVNNTGVDGGGAYFGWNSDGSLINNTICHNESPLGAALELTNCRPLFINNIIGDNGGFEIHLQDKFTHLTVENNIIANGETTIWGAGTYDIVSLIEENPLFKSASGGMGSGEEGLEGTDWSVENTSPALNAGISDLENIPLPYKDLQGNSRIHHDIIDIGAYEVHIPKITFADTIKSDTTWIADTVAIAGNVTVNDIQMSEVVGVMIDILS